MISEVGVAKRGKTPHRDATQAQPSNLSRQCTIFPVPDSLYRRYAIVDETMQREAAARLDAWMAAPPAPPSTATVAALRRGSRLRGRVTG
jgi:hypothetical protein